MRNRYPGTCYRCGSRVDPGDGHFERFRGTWRTQHAACAIKHRGTPDDQRASERMQKLRLGAQCTGKRAGGRPRKGREDDCGL